MRVNSGLVDCYALSQYLNWLFDKWTVSDQLQWNFSYNGNSFCHENELWKCDKISAIFVKALMSWMIRRCVVAYFSWGLGYQKQVSRAETSNYIPQIPWDVITCPSSWYLLLTHHFSITAACRCQYPTTGVRMCSKLTLETLDGVSCLRLRLLMSIPLTRIFPPHLTWLLELNFCVRICAIIHLYTYTLRVIRFRISCNTRVVCNKMVIKIVFSNVKFINFNIFKTLINIVLQSSEAYILTHCDLLTSYGDRGLGKHWLG